MDRCPHYGVALPAIRDAFCPECRQDLDEPGNEPALAREPSAAVASEPPSSTTPTRYRVGEVCPACQSPGYRQVRPDRWIAFRWDRVCKSCNTRYTPPTPPWAGGGFLVAGLPLAAFGLFGVIGSLVQGNPLPIACEGGARFARGPGRHSRDTFPRVPRPRRGVREGRP
jgi:hypothetical protein